MELNRGGYGHPAYDNVHAPTGNPHDPLGLNQYLLDPEDAYRMSLPPPFKPKQKPEAADEHQPASPSSPGIRALRNQEMDQAEQPMDSLPHTTDVDTYLAHKAQQNIADPTANATQYKASETIENLRRNEIDPRHVIEKPGIHVSGGKPGMSPRARKNFIAMNKSHTGAFDNYQVNKQKVARYSAKQVTAEPYSPSKANKKMGSGPRTNEIRLV